MTSAGRSGAGRDIQSPRLGSKRNSPFRHLLSWLLPFGTAAPSVAASKADESSSSPGARSVAASGGGTDAVAAIFVLICLLLLGQALVRPKVKTPPPIQGGNPNLTVWVDTRTGLYYCPSADSFGKGRGSYLAQHDAQVEHFRPAFDKPCED